MIEYVGLALIIATFFTAFRILAGPTVWDRLLGFNLLSSKVIVLIILYGLLIDKSYILDIAITYALLGFISTLFIARFIRDKGKI